jgi:murein DD-endopeptidase MepM/ murein hydrolase activator NlpD
MYRPSKGPITQEYGNLQPDGLPHTGYDFGFTDGVRTFPDVYAAAAGTVLYAGDSRHLGWPNPWYFNPDFDRTDAVDTSAGNVLVIGHDDGVTTYSHLESWDVAKGAEVRQGQRVATVGNTGYSFGKHLHFEWIPYPFDFGTPAYGRERPSFSTVTVQSTPAAPAPAAPSKGPLMALSDNEQKEILLKVRELHRDYKVGIPGVQTDGDAASLFRQMARKVGVNFPDALRQRLYGKKK